MKYLILLTLFLVWIVHFHYPETKGASFSSTVWQHKIYETHIQPKRVDMVGKYGYLGPIWKIELRDRILYLPEEWTWIEEIK